VPAHQQRHQRNRDKDHGNDPDPTLGSVEAPDEDTAIAEAVKEFHITPARRNKLVVTKVIVTDRDSNKSPDASLG
jgi:hypothetical protein